METVKIKTKLRFDPKTGGCWLDLPFDPKEKFGKVRAPVVVTVNDYAFRTTIAAMGGKNQIVINKANRERAGIGPEDNITATVELDTVPRTVTPPQDLKKVLGRNKAAAAVWEKLSYTHKREYAEWIEEAKKPETRERRVAKTIEALLERS